MISEMLAIIVSINVGNYIFPKYWLLEITEMLAIMFLEMMATNVSNHLFRKWRRMLTIIIFRNVSDFDFQERWRQFLAIIIFINSDDKC